LSILSTGGTDGEYSFEGPVRDCEGNLYETTGYGGDLSGCESYGCGVVFKIAFHEGRSY
jgi:hypothetical protein